MKKTHSFLLTATLTTFSLASFGQNTFPASGNVGIGTANPQYRLQMQGDHNTTNMNLHYHHTDPTLHADLTLWASEPGWTYTGAGIGNNVFNSPTSAGVIRINNSKGGSYIRLLDQELKFNIVKSDGTDISAMTLDGTGNVGIGMINPLAKLSIASNTSLPSSAGLGYGTVHFKPSENATDQLTGLTFGANVGGTTLATGAHAGIYVQSSGNYGTNMFFGTTDSYAIGSKTRMVINYAGDVGIGTTDPKGYKLAVAGNMIAESVKVKLQGTWPDYVFAKDYQLPTLQETEKHIKDKGHLPGIPSAAEVKANGVDLGEMNAKLLQKIEELTLHLIEMNSRLSVVENENAVLKKSLNK